MEAKELLKTLSKDQETAQSELSDDMNRPSLKKSHLELLALSDDDLQDRGPLPDRQGDPGPHPEMDPGGQGQLSEQGDQQHRPAAGGDHQRHHPLPLHLRRQLRAFAAHGKGTARFPDPPLLFRSARVHQYRQEPYRGPSFLRPRAKDHLPRQRLRPPGRQERRALPGPEDPVQAGRVFGNPERPAGSPRPGTSPPTPS